MQDPPDVRHGGAFEVSLFMTGAQIGAARREIGATGPAEGHTHMKSYVRKTMVSIFAAATVVGVTAAPASAAQQVQDGLVNVAVGDITIQDINVGVAALIAANICGVRVGPVAVLATLVDRTGSTTTVCESDQGDVVISQN